MSLIPKQVFSPIRNNYINVMVLYTTFGILAGLGIETIAFHKLGKDYIYHEASLQLFPTFHMHAHRKKQRMLRHVFL